jgi:two-component system NtrC family sensor kinase
VLSSLERIRKTEQHLAIAQRLAATGKLASGIAHEINNPLGGMRSAARALLRGDLPPEKTTQYLDLILDGLARIEETVKKFLSFTPRRVEPRPTDLADVARKAAALARHRLEKCGVRYGEDLPAPGTARVFGDPHELQQVALNLLLNAADATAGAKDARVDLRVRSRGEEVSLEVVDNGVGLSPEDQRCCFDLFFTTKSAGEGSGLGLAVAHTIVTNHGGRIEVESEVGKGATFRVVLPAEPSGEGAARRRDQGPGSGSPAPGTSG